MAGVGQCLGGPPCEEVCACVSVSVSMSMCACACSLLPDTPKPLESKMSLSCAICRTSYDFKGKVIEVYFQSNIPLP